MSAPSQPLQDIEVRAANWILRRDRGELTPQDHEELNSWLSAEACHREVYLNLLEAWRVSTGFKSWRPADGQIRTDVFETFSTVSPTMRKLGFWPYALAAVVILTVSACVLLWNRDADRSLYATQVGGYQRVLLDDGSVVQLNTDTRVRVRQTQTERVVHLDRGEAYFEINRDPSRPFEVITADSVIQAVGTEFDVHRTGRSTEVTVTQGKVKLTADPSVPAMPLIAGESAQATPGQIHVAHLETSEVSRRLAWQVGELHFKHQPLADVAAEFNRYNRRHLEIVSPELGSLEVGGNFKVNDMRSFVAAIQGELNIRVEESPDRIRIFATTSVGNLPPGASSR